MLLPIVIILATDFDSAMQTVTIIAGTNSSMVNIPVTNDNVVERDETFIMSLSIPSSLGSKITTGTITSTTVTIIDTSSKYFSYSVSFAMFTFVCLFVHTLLGLRVRFVSSLYTGSEAIEFVVVTLELSGGISTYPFNVTVVPLEQSPVSAKGNIHIVHYFNAVQK